MSRWRTKEPTTRPRDSLVWPRGGPGGGGGPRHGSGLLLLCLQSVSIHKINGDASEDFRGKLHCCGGVFYTSALSYKTKLCWEHLFLIFYGARGPTAVMHQEVFV